MLGAYAVAAAAAEPLRTVSHVDLAKYAGTWYEAARTPNRFEKKCAGDVRVTYRVREDGKVAVRNECRQMNGKQDVANGSARVPDAREPGKLKVTFFWPFSGNYWILDLDPQYRWALVGEPDRKYLWVLTRQPSIEDGLYRDLVSRAAAQGYDVSRISRTDNSRLATAASK